MVRKQTIWFFYHIGKGLSQWMSHVRTWENNVFNLQLFRVLWTLIRPVSLFEYSISLLAFPSSYSIRLTISNFSLEVFIHFSFNVIITLVKFLYFFLFLVCDLFLCFSFPVLVSIKLRFSLQVCYSCIIIIKYSMLSLIGIVSVPFCFIFVHL